MARTWKKQCQLNLTRLDELRELFNQQREKMYNSMLGAQAAPKKLQNKEPFVSILSTIKGDNAYIPKKLKKLKDIKRDALLARFFLKCQRAHSDKFFQWREKFFKLKLI
jgi:hypothetical protein